MLAENMRRVLLKRLRRPNLENLARQALCKQVLSAARKVNVCQYCGAMNGTVKKAAALKIVHERFRQKKLTEEAEKWRQSFSNAIKLQGEIDRLLGVKGAEELNPLKVLDLFKRMTTEVSLLGSNLQFMLNLSLGLRVGWSQAVSQPARTLSLAIYRCTSCSHTSICQSGRGKASISSRFG